MLACCSWPRPLCRGVIAIFMLSCLWLPLRANELQDALLAGAANLARQQLSANAVSESGLLLVQFAQLLDRNGSASLVELRRQLASGQVQAPSFKVTERDFLAILQMVLAQENRPARQLLYHGVVRLFDPTNEAARIALTAARLRGDETDLGKLLTRELAAAVVAKPTPIAPVVPVATPPTPSPTPVAVPEAPAPVPAKRLVSESLAYSKRLVEPARTLLESDLERRFGERVLEDSADYVQRRLQAKEADAALAKQSQELLVEMRALLTLRRKAEDEMARAKSYEPPFKDPNPTRHDQKRREARDLKARNASNSWQAASAAYRTGKYLTKVEQLREAENLLADEVRRADELLAASQARPTSTHTDGEWRNGMTPRPADGQPGTTPVTTPELVWDPPPRLETVEEVPEERAVTPREPPTYNPEPATSPADLQTLMLEMEQWLRAQSDRAGTRLVSKMFAKRDNGHLVLYLAATTPLVKSKPDSRRQIYETVWNFWSMRCLTNRKVTGKEYAHLVMIDEDGLIIGGSSADKASDIWVER